MYSFSQVGLHASIVLYVRPSIICTLVYPNLRSGCPIKSITSTSVCSIRVFRDSFANKCTCFTDLNNLVFWRWVWVYCTAHKLWKLDQWNSNQSSEKRATSCISALQFWPYYRSRFFDALIEVLIHYYTLYWKVFKNKSQIHWNHKSNNYSPVAVRHNLALESIVGFLWIMFPISRVSLLDIC